jgi:CRISPR-associated protein Cas2
MTPARFMRLLVFFDLPTATKKERREYTKFRKFLLKNGYDMLQFSVYCLICKGQDTAERYMSHLETNLPPKGNVRAMSVTNTQYERMKILIGIDKKEEKIGAKQLLLF